MAPGKPPPPRPGSSPALPKVEVDRTVGGAEHQRRFDEPKRTTLTDLQAVRPADRQPTLSGLPAPPALPLEHAPTKPAPHQPWGKTMRAPTPPEVVAAARRSDPAPADHPGAGLQSAQEALLRDELARERAKSARLERDARAAAEARIQSFPPPVQRSQSPAPSSAPAKVDQAIGKGVRLLLGRHVVALLAAAGVGGGVTAIAKPSVDPAKAEATLANVEAIRADLTLIREQLSGVIKREAARDVYIRCIDEGLNDVGSQLLPAQDRASAAQPIRAWIDRCQRLRP